MLEKAIVDKLDPNKSKEYILSIRLGTDGFSFSVYNPIRDCILLSQQRDIKEELTLTTNLKEAFRDLDYLSYTYKQVNVTYVNRRFTLVPLELFEEEAVETYFSYNYSSKDNEIVLYNTLNRSGVVVLYGMDRSLHRFLCEHYPQIEFCSFVTPRAEHLALNSRLGSAKKMYAYVHAEFIELYAYERGHLLLLNSFDCKQTPDRMYYILYAWKQLAMDQQTDELILANIEEEHELPKELKRFIQHVLP